MLITWSQCTFSAVMDNADTVSAWSLTKWKHFPRLRGHDNEHGDTDEVHYST